MICVPICEASIESMQEGLKYALSIADLAEIRLDYLSELNESALERLIKSENKQKLIITCRRKNEGGKAELSETHRINILKKAISLGAGYVDIELSSNKSIITEIIKNKKESKIILSHHDFASSKNLICTYDKLASFKPDIIKIVSTAQNLSDNLLIKELLRSAKLPTIAFCMGEKGITSRVLALCWGSYLTFAHKSQKTAEGQISLDDALNIYRVKEISKKTKILGLIGNPVMQSKGKTVHNILLREKNCVYIPFQTEKLSDFFKLSAGLNFLGASITMPYKEEVMDYLDNIDKPAKEIGAVNTISYTNNKMTGFNTDYIGIIAPLSKSIELKNKKIIILGAGGAARAAVYGLRKYTPHIRILNRTKNKAKQLADEFKCQYGSIDDIETCDVIINASSVGMSPNTNNSLIKKEFFTKEIVFELVYNPKMTQLLKDAKEKGLEIIYGIDMYKYQAVEQIKLWTGIEITFGEISQIIDTKK